LLSMGCSLRSNGLPVRASNAGNTCVQNMISTNSRWYGDAAS
jgi:hypothetical protein